MIYIPESSSKHKEPGASFMGELSSEKVTKQD